MADQDAAQAFRKIVTRHSSQTADNAGLVNVAFFVGAGFSKTWDSTSPTGNELFTFPKAFLEEDEWPPIPAEWRWSRCTYAVPVDELRLCHRDHS
jgi:hypothetical protein